MSTVVLSAASPERPPLQELSAQLDAALREGGETDVHTFALATTPLAYCQGEFDCWVKTPGLCRAHDAEEGIVRAIHGAKRVVLLDAVTFGGHSYTVKRAQDRLICLISPFFEKRAALTHHEARYARMPDFCALGWMPVADAGERDTWCALADANALNMLAPRVGAAVLDDAARAEWPATIRAALASRTAPGAGITGRGPLRDALLAVAAGGPAPGGLAPPRRAAVVVGSAKARGTSVSENLARALAARLDQAGVATEIHFVTEFLRDERAAATAQSVAAADLFALVTPLYVDAFPALATRVLESVAAVRAASPAPAQFAALVNCGFPEAEHNRTALRIARHFAARAGYSWAGGLPLGGGGAVKPAVPLDAQHGPAEHVKGALDLAAACLARGAAVPADAIARMAQAPMPDALYRFAGDLGWRYQAYKNGLAQAELRSRPFD